MRASKNRCFHLAMVRELSLKLEYKSPAANRKMMRARRAKSARPRPVRARDSRALRSSPVSTMSAVVCGMRHTNIYMSLVQATSVSDENAANRDAQAAGGADSAWTALDSAPRKSSGHNDVRWSFLRVIGRTASVDAAARGSSLSTAAVNTWQGTRKLLALSR